MTVFPAQNSGLQGSGTIFYPAPAGGGGDFITNYTTNTTAIIGAVTTSKGIISAWIKPNQDNTDQCVIYGALANGTAGFQLIRLANNKYQFEIWKSSFTIFYVLKTVNAYTSSTYPNWLNILVSWDTNFANGSKLGNLYINDVRDTSVTDGQSAWSLDYTSIASWATFASLDTISSQPGTTNLSMVYFYPNQYLDFTIIANRRKFISATHRPVFLGSNGALPLNSQPPVFFKGVGSGFNTNSGSGPNFTTIGTITTPTTTPSNP